MNRIMDLAKKTNRLSKIIPIVGIGYILYIFLPLIGYYNLEYSIEQYINGGAKTQDVFASLVLYNMLYLIGTLILILPLYFVIETVANIFGVFNKQEEARILRIINKVLAVLIIVALIVMWLFMPQVYTYIVDSLTQQNSASQPIFVNFASKIILLGVGFHLILLSLALVVLSSESGLYKQVEFASKLLLGGVFLYFIEQLYFVGLSMIFIPISVFLLSRRLRGITQKIIAYSKKRQSI